MKRLSFPHALFVLAGRKDAECIAGDLQEEFAMLRDETGAAGARRWYAWQLLRSLAGPLVLRICTTVVVVGLPLALFERMWLFVYAQLCAEPVEGLLPVNTFGLLAGACLLHPSRRAATSSLLAIGLAAELMIGPAAFPHIISVLLSVPTGALAAQLKKVIV